MTDPDHRPQSVRWPFVAAGLAALAVTLIRAIAGGQTDLPLMQQGLDNPAIAAVIRINWHLVTAIFATLAAALLLSSPASRDTARAVGFIATFVFAAAAIIFMIETAKATGSPFTYFPYAPLGLTAVLSAFATWRA